MTVSITYNGQSFDVTGTYDSGEPDVWYLPNGDPGHPGTPSSFDIDSIVWTSSENDDVDVTELIETIGGHSTWNDIEHFCIEKIENY